LGRTPKSPNLRTPDLDKPEPKREKKKEESIPIAKWKQS
jgi:hypothetical protein